ncbi:MAG: filament integrity protein FraC [Cyanobacteria bacterium J06634_6]
MDYAAILPLKAIVFQGLFFLVAITIEAGLLRQRLRLGFKTSVQYAFVTNLAAVVAGWIAFLVIEPLVTTEIRAQIINYIFFNRLLVNGWSTQLGAIVLVIAIVSFFGAFFIKAKGIEYFLRSDKNWKTVEKEPRQLLSREARYAKARGGRTEEEEAETASYFTDSVIQANAASFSVILLLLILRTVIEGWVA